ncbi:hypothetical protein LshimejAT787_1301010 [Lyophyllum shimeji]|uniref:Uncharacterized protein n=1 Tax=Lyophyllum shimeji TaxID=47721 RepID=A0A9P3PUK6_LYOSH|nr:hypothetical protein LshimejAT787_1301010 [Lyophyllum shimeji]
MGPLFTALSFLVTPETLHKQADNASVEPTEKTTVRPSKNKGEVPRETRSVGLPRWVGHRLRRSTSPTVQYVAVVLSALHGWDDLEHVKAVKSVCKVPLRFAENSSRKRTVKDLKSPLTRPDILSSIEIVGFCSSPHPALRLKHLLASLLLSLLTTSGGGASSLLGIRVRRAPRGALRRST